MAPETGTEDISYAAAFEVGRLLAAADRRLAQALMRWRRESYKQSARAEHDHGAVNARVPLDLPATLAEQLHTPITPRVATAARSRRRERRIRRRATPMVSGAVANVPGLNPAALAAAWQLPSGERGDRHAWRRSRHARAQRSRHRAQTAAGEHHNRCRCGRYRRSWTDLAPARDQAVANAAAFLGDD